MLKDFKTEFERYKVLGEKALKQVPDGELNHRLGGGELNSVTMIVRHISGNFRSRFTDFLTTDGEKPWRNRDSEFDDVRLTRKQLMETWGSGWAVLFDALDQLKEEDAERQVTIRGVALTVNEALLRSLAHVAMHIGQIILLARLTHSGEWQALTIPKGQSAQYNQNPTMEKQMT
jgi:hypothetical protein